MPIRDDDYFMAAALREARKGRGHTSPNPRVGAVLVVGGKIVARGHHERAGGPHAEIQCLTKFGKRLPRDAVLYVTLEPCSTIGKTGRCTDALIAAGLRQIVVGAIDPNPRHNGRGITKLQRAGMTVRTGVMEKECRELNESFNKWITTGRPFVIAKCGMSLDGRLVPPPGEGQWITSPASRRDAQQLRAQVDAILVGGETIRRDNPRLTVRGIMKATQPWRVIVTRSRKLPRNTRVLSDRWKEKTIVYRGKSLPAVLRDLGKRSVLSVMIEGGGHTLGQALDDRLIDKVQIYIGAVFTGGATIAFGGRGAGSTSEAARLERVSFTRIGQDVRVTGYVAGTNSE